MFIPTLSTHISDAPLGKAVEIVPQPEEELVRDLGDVHIAFYRIDNLYHRGFKRHSQHVRGTPHELLKYIAGHEAYERRLVPPLENKNRDLNQLRNFLLKGEEAKTS